MADIKLPPGMEPVTRCELPLLGFETPEAMYEGVYRAFRERDEQWAAHVEKLELKIDVWMETAAEDDATIGRLQDRVAELEAKLAEARRETWLDALEFARRRQAMFRQHAPTDADRWREATTFVNRFEARSRATGPASQPGAAVPESTGAVPEQSGGATAALPRGEVAEGARDMLDGDPEVRAAIRDIIRRYAHEDGEMDWNALEGDLWALTYPKVECACGWKGRAGETVTEAGLCPSCQRLPAAPPSETPPTEVDPRAERHAEIRANIRRKRSMPSETPPGKCGTCEGTGEEPRPYGPGVLSCMDCNGTGSLAPTGKPVK